MAKHLETKVLKGVSRSFYLSLRFLPKGFRRPASLGYLLARLSDTLADCEDIPVQKRKEALVKFKEAVACGAIDVPTLGAFNSEVANASERVLLANSHDCLRAVQSLPEWQQEAVRRVVATITDGQLWDLERFGESEAEVVSLESVEELERYTYRVAGCVGEFWTELAHGLDRFPPELTRKMMEAGKHYGQALQLINIIRDRDRDVELGRCYVPDEPEAVRRWSGQAREWLEEGEWYCRRLRGKRLRFSSWLPLLIGRRTLDLIEGDGGSGPKKITRKELRMEMKRAARLALSRPVTDI